MRRRTVGCQCETVDLNGCGNVDILNRSPVVAQTSKFSSDVLETGLEVPSDLIWSNKCQFWSKSGVKRTATRQQDSNIATDTCSFAYHRSPVIPASTFLPYGARALDSSNLSSPDHRLTTMMSSSAQVWTWYLLSFASTAPGLLAW